jgi:putative transposase
LTAAQWRRLGRVLDRGAVAGGFETEQWTLRRVAAVVERAFGVRYHFRSLGRALRARGVSPQRPIPRAREREDALVEAWPQRDWPRLQRGLGVPR